MAFQVVTSKTQGIPILVEVVTSNTQGIPFVFEVVTSKTQGIQIVFEVVASNTQLRLIFTCSLQRYVDEHDHFQNIADEQKHNDP